MNGFTWYTQLWVNRRCRRAWYARGEAKYNYHYRTSWMRYCANVPDATPTGVVTIEVLN